MKKLLAVVLVIPALALLTACGSQTKVKQYSNNAVNVCGKGNVAFVDAEHGKFGCKGAAQAGQDDRG